MLKRGDVIQTSYETGPYRIWKVLLDCICPDFLNSLEFGDDAPPSRPHIHLVVVLIEAKPTQDGSPSEKDFRWLNGYEEDTLRSVWNDDFLTVVSQIGQEEFSFAHADTGRE